jgi:hypothetical protein
MNPPLILAVKLFSDPAAYLFEQPYSGTYITTSYKHSNFTDLWLGTFYGYYIVVFYILALTVFCQTRMP